LITDEVVAAATCSPFVEDGLEYWAIVRLYVEDFFAAVSKNEAKEAKAAEEVKKI